MAKVRIEIAPSLGSLLGKVRLNIRPSTVGMSDEGASDWAILDREVREWSLISDLFEDLAYSYTDFRKAVFDPDTGKVSDQVMVVLNDRLLEFPAIEAKLSNGDTIRLLLVYAGG